MAFGILYPYPQLQNILLLWLQRIGVLKLEGIFLSRDPGKV